MEYDTSHRRASLFVLILASISMPLLAQQDTTSAIPFQNNWAMEFGIGSNLTLTSFLDADLAGAKYMTDGTKIRLALRLRANSSENESNESEVRADTLYVSSENMIESSWQSVALTLGYFGYTRQLQRVSLFIGGGPIVSYYFRHDKSSSKYVYPSSWGERYTYDETERSWSIGATCGAGVEWFFANQMSLHAEYDIDAVYSKGTTSRDSYYFPFYYGSDSRIKRETKSSGWRVGSQLIRFGITICY